MTKTKRCLSVLTVLTLVISLMLPIVVHAEGYSNTFTPEFVDNFIRGDLIFNRNASSKTVDYLNAIQNNNYAEIGWQAGTQDQAWFQRYKDGYILTNVNNNTKVVVNMYKAATYLDKVIDIQYEYNNFNVGGHLNLTPIFAVQKNSVTNMTQNIYSQGITDYDVIVRFKDHATGRDINLSNAYVAFGFYNYREGTAFGTNIEKVLVKNDTVMSNFISDGVLFSQSGYLYSKNYFWPWLICVSQEDHFGREAFATQVKIKDNSSYFTYKIMPGNGYTMELNMTSDVNLLVQRGFAEVLFYDVDRNDLLLEYKTGYAGSPNSLITDVYTNRLDDINYYKNRGYELVTDGFSSNPKFVANQTTIVKIYLKHTYTTVDKDTYEKDKCLNTECTVKQPEKGC